MRAARCARKGARVVTSYEERLARKLPGENSKKIAADIAAREGMSERSVRRWVAQIRERGDARRKSGSGRPKLYTDDVVKEIIEINQSYEGHAASRDVAEVLKAKFGVGSKTSCVFPAVPRIVAYLVRRCEQRVQRSDDL